MDKIYMVNIKFFSPSLKRLGVIAKIKTNKYKNNKKISYKVYTSSVRNI